MARFYTYAALYDGKVPEDFGVSKTRGSSLTIPGQGCDLAQIISSIVKLPPLDERTFDCPSGSEPDINVLAVKTALDGTYLAEGKNMAEDAIERKKGREKVKEVNDEKKEEPKADDAAEE